MGCPVDDCEIANEVKDHHSTLYGNGSKKGIAYTFVSRTSMWVAIAVIGIPLFSVGAYTWKNQSVIEEKLRSINKMISLVQKDQEIMKTDSLRQLNEIKVLIKNGG